MIYIMSSNNLEMYETKKYEGIFFEKTSGRWKNKIHCSKAITSKLKEKKGFYIRINDDEECKLNGDIEHVSIKK